MSQLSSTPKSLGQQVSKTMSAYYSLSTQEHRDLKNATHYTWHMLDKVYHSESMHEMQVNADLQGVDLCNPHVLLFLAKETAYHHAYWPHTAKRFLAFKNILRRNKDVRKSLRDGIFMEMLAKHLSVVDFDIGNDLMYDTPGRKQEIKNLKQLVGIVEKAMKANEA